ncbi:MAG: DEAD/DEAH box helicase [Pseudomonadota bacterium]
MTTFEDLGLLPVLLGTAETAGYETPTPIQRDAIPVALSGEDIIGLAQTGTGKTAAFGLPLIQSLLQTEHTRAPKTTRSLIIAPTRELVTQIFQNLLHHVRKTHLRIESVIGGVGINGQARRLERGVDILVATPGRLLDLVNRGALNIGEVRFLVLDEADQMLDLGFVHDLRKIARLVGQPRQTMLFSATMPKSIEELAQKFLTDPVSIAVSRPGKSADNIRQSVHFVGARDKTTLLKDLLIERRDDVSLVFMATKHASERLTKHLLECGYKAAAIHGNKSQGQRERAIRGFREGTVKVLVATDIAARGIDIQGVTHVYNFNLPDVPEVYVHRIGRTARAGAKGEAITLCAPAEIRLLRAIEKLMKNAIPVASGEVPEDQPTEKRGGNRPAGRKAGSSRRPAGPKKSGSSANKGKPRRSKGGRSKDGRPKTVAGSSANAASKPTPRPARKPEGKPAARPSAQNRRTTSRHRRSTSNRAKAPTG